MRRRRDGREPAVADGGSAARSSVFGARWRRPYAGRRRPVNRPAAKSQEAKGRIRSIPPRRSPIDSGRFVPFGLAHVAAIALPIAAGVLLACLVRKKPESGGALAVRPVLAGAIVVVIGFVLIAALREGWLTLELVLPLHLCDLALLLSVYALATRSRAVSEVLWFWAGAGTILAMLTPDVGRGFPHREFLFFFGLHGLVVMSAIVLVFGWSLRPRPGSARRVFFLTAAYAAFVGAVNAVLGTNFLFLCRKPPNPTLLDAFGPWPVYIVVAAGFAFALFSLLELPFPRESST